MGIRQLRPVRHLEIESSGKDPCLMDYRQRRKLAYEILMKGESGPP